MNQVPTSEASEEEIEGIGSEADGSWGDYPIDTLLIRNETRTVHDILRRIEQGSFIMDPDFQRDFVWDDEKQSKLIESVLLRIPLPVFYLAEDPKGRMIVVDGLQRLSTFRRFVNDKLRLKLRDQPELNGKRFSDLSPKLQNRLEDCNLILYVIDSKVPERARLDIFDRVNGGVPLTRQQMRNCLYMGDATRFLKAEATTEVFLQATGQSLRSLPMRDREFVNRFCAFRLLPVDEYRDMDDFLARALRRMNELPTSELNDLSRDFRESLKTNWDLFGRHAFRKHQRGQDTRSVLNASLWDVMSVGLSRYERAATLDRKESVIDEFYHLLDNSDFVTSITYSTNDLKQVRCRFSMMNDMLERAIGAH